MANPPPDIAVELTNTILSLQTTARNVREKLEKEHGNPALDLTQPIGHLLDSLPATHILDLATPTSTTLSTLSSLETQLSALQQTLLRRGQWRWPPAAGTGTAPAPPPQPIPCTTDYLDLSDLATAVKLLGSIVASANPDVPLTPRAAFKDRTWSWDPVWREFFSTSPSLSDSTIPQAPPSSSSLYLSRWFFDPRTQIWHHANMADSGLMPDEAQQRLGAWEDWEWDVGSGEWGLDVSGELEEGVRGEGAKLWVFASRWVEREGTGWVYVGGRGG